MVLSARVVQVEGSKIGGGCGRRGIEAEEDSISGKSSLASVIEQSDNASHILLLFA